MTETTNYSLKKPDQSDRVLIADLNGNADTIDTELKKNADTIQYVSDKANENETAISELQSKSETAETDITKLKNKDTQTDVEINGLKTRVQSTEDWIKGISNPLVIKGIVSSVEDLEEKTSEAKAGWIYFVGAEDAKDYDEYVYTESNKWEKLGHMDIDLSKYATVDSVTSQLSAKADKTALSAYATTTDVESKLSKKADVSALSGYVKTESLPEVFNDYGIENEQEVPILKQTIGYESRNLFDFDAWYASITRTIGGTLSKIDNGCILKTTGAALSYTEPFVSTSSGVYKIPVFPNTTYILSYIATGDYDTAVFFNGISSNEHKERTFVTSSDTTFITFRLVAKNSGSANISNIQLQLANAKTDDTYQPYTPTVNDRLSVLEGLIKKKTITGTTNGNGNLILDKLTATNSIVLSAIETSDIADDTSIIGAPYTSNTGVWYLHVTKDNSSFGEVISRQVGFTVYYLEIPSGYEIPDTTAASSDEPEDDEGFSPQADFSNEESANYEE